ALRRPLAGAFPSPLGGIPQRSSPHGSRGHAMLYIRRQPAERSDRPPDGDEAERMDWEGSAQHMTTEDPSLDDRHAIVPADEVQAARDELEVGAGRWQEITRAVPTLVAAAVLGAATVALLRSE